MTSPDQVFIEIAERKFGSYRPIQLLRHELDTETQFTTTTWFDNIESVKEFAGDHFDAAYVPAKARKVLSGLEDQSIHCKLRHEFHYDL